MTSLKTPSKTVACGLRFSRLDKVCAIGIRNGDVCELLREKGNTDETIEDSGANGENVKDKKNDGLENNIARTHDEKVMKGL